MSGPNGRPDPAKAPDQLSWRARLLLGGYPPWWRLRYDDEMRDTLLALREARGCRQADSWDLARGLVDAWLHPTLTSSEARMSDHTARLLSRTAWGLLILVLAGAAFAKVIENPVFTAAADADPALMWSVVALRAAGLACAAVIAIAAVAAGSAVRRLPASDRRRCLLLLAVVPASAAGWFLALAGARLMTDSTPVHSSAQIAAFVALAAATVLAGACSTAALLQINLRLPQRGFVTPVRTAAMVATGVFVAVAALSVAVWTVVIAAQSPHLLGADYGLLATPTVITMLAVVAGLAAAASLCGRGAIGVLSNPADAPRSSH